MTDIALDSRDTTASKWANLGHETDRPLTMWVGDHGNVRLAKADAKGKGK
jgi:hypothetical protein